MTPSHHAVTRRRLASQGITPGRPPEFSAVVDVVRWMTAMQAQDFLGAKWSIGLRLPVATDADVETALADGSILRSWPLRGTLHFVASEDLHWMLELTRDRMIKRSAANFAAEALTEAVLDRAGDTVGAALAEHGQLTRDAVYELLADSGVSTTGQARYHALWYLCQIGLLCLGPPQGKSQTFVLLDAWVPKPRVLERDEALGELAARYFRSHGPATDRDFAWWSSLTLTQARQGLAVIGDRLERRTMGGVDYHFSPDLPEPRAAAGAHLLPGFDEYLLGYTDRSAALADEHVSVVFPGKNGMFLPTIVEDGAVVGTWKRTMTARHVSFAFHPFAPLSAETAASVEDAAERYAEFVGLERRVAA